MDPNTYFLSIDPSVSNTGLSIMSMTDDNKFILHHKTSISAKRSVVNDRTKFQKKYVLFELFVFYIQHVINVLKLDISFAVFEDYSYGSIGHLAHLGELNGMYKYELTRLGIPFDVIPPSSVKKIVGGSGRADKILVASKLKDFVINIDNFTFNNNDETDSVAVGIAYCLNMVNLINEPNKNTKKD